MNRTNYWFADDKTEEVMYEYVTSDEVFEHRRNQIDNGNGGFITNQDFPTYTSGEIIPILSLQESISYLERPLY